MSKAIKFMAVMGLAMGTLPGLAQESNKRSQPSVDASIAPLLKALDYKYEVDDDGDYKLVLDVDGKRTQLVFVRSKVEEYGGQRIREVWSAGYQMEKDGAFPTVVANRLLEASMDSKMGGWGKQGPAAIYIVRIPANADRDTLDRAITAAIDSADEMEAELTPGKDDL